MGWEWVGGWVGGWKTDLFVGLEKGELDSVYDFPAFCEEAVPDAGYHLEREVGGWVGGWVGWVEEEKAV